MERREFLRTIGGGAAGAALVVGCGGEQQATAQAPAVITGQKVRWRLASSFPRSLDTIYGAAEVLAERVSALTDGAFQIQVYPAGELVPALKVLDAVQQGTVPIGQSASYYYTGKNPALAFDTCVPFGLSARQQDAWLQQGGGAALMARRFADFGVLSFQAGNTGAQMGGWFKQAIGGPEDLRALKIRIPGLGGEVMARLGATVQVLPGGEIYPALERGAIDATEWVGPADDEQLGFWKVAKFYCYPGWWEPGPSLSYYVGRQAWDALPRVYQEVFAAAATQSATAMQTRYDARNPPALQRLVDHGVTLHPFSDALMTAAQEATTSVLEDQAAADPEYRQLYDAWTSFRSASFRWFATAELAYGRFAFPRG